MLDGLRVSLHFCGESGSGKSSAIKDIAKQVSDIGFNVYVVEEGTDTFYEEQDIETYDGFCKLPVGERRKRSVRLLQNRIEKEQAVVNEVMNAENGKPSLILYDRPWWDAYYYSIKRSRKGTPESHYFSLLNSVYLNGPPAYVPMSVPIYVYLSPLAPKLLKEDEDTINSRPSFVVKNDRRSVLRRLDDYINYVLNGLTMQFVQYQTNVYPFVPMLIMERLSEFFTGEGEQTDYFDTCISHLMGLRSLYQTAILRADDLSKEEKDRLFHNIREILFIQEYKQRNELISFMVSRLQEMKDTVRKAIEMKQHEQFTNLPTKTKYLN